MIRPACAATTQRGTAYKGIVPLGRTLCLVHDPDLADKVAEARRRGGTTAMKLKLLAGRRQRLDTPKKLLAFVSDLAVDTLSGAVQPDVSRATAYAISLQMKLIETGDLEKRLASLEANLVTRWCPAASRGALVTMHARLTRIETERTRRLRQRVAAVLAPLEGIPFAVAFERTAVDPDDQAAVLARFGRGLVGVGTLTGWLAHRHGLTTEETAQAVALAEHVHALLEDHHGPA